MEGVSKYKCLIIEAYVGLSESSPFTAHGGKVNKKTTHFWVVFSFLHQ